MDVIRKFVSLKQPENDRALGLETPSEYRERWISIRVMYYNGFLIYVAFGIITTSVWPYLKSVRILLYNMRRYWRLCLTVTDCSWIQMQRRLS